MVFLKSAFLYIERTFDKHSVSKAILTRRIWIRMKKQQETMPTLKVLRLVKPCFRQKRLQQVKQKQSEERVNNRSLSILLKIWTV